MSDKHYKVNPEPLPCGCDPCDGCVDWVEQEKRDAERRIIEWLRSTEAFGMGEACQDPDEIADAIERGEHRGE